MLEIFRFEDVIQIRMCSDTGRRIPYWVSAYLIDGILIDTGSVYTSTSLAEYLRSERVALIVNTHHHEDHIGGNDLIQRRFGIPLYAHPVAIPSIRHAIPISDYRQNIWGVPPPSDPRPMPSVINTDKYAFEVIETPGHCPGHISMVERDMGWIFSGDLYICRRPRTAAPENDLGQLISSMKKICELPLERTVLFTSLRTIETKGREKLLSCMNWYGELASRVSEMRYQGYNTDQMVDALFGGESVLERITGGLYTSRRLVNKLLAYSDKQLLQW